MEARPSPKSAWVKVLGSVEIEWPWPYRIDEVEQLLSRLPATHARGAVEQIVLQARLYLSPPAAAARAVDIKPNPARQTERLSRALQSVSDALRELDVEALRHLEANAFVDDQRPMVFLTAVYGFETNAGLSSLPESDVGPGRKANTHLGTFQERIRAIYNKAFGGTPPFRGWPAFRDICMAPIDLLPPEPKSRDDQLRAAKRRKNKPA